MNMQSRNALALAFSSLLLGVGAGSAVAAPCSGYNAHFPISAETNELSKGYLLITFRNHDVVITDDPKQILNNTIGECSGTVIVLPDGKSSSMGHCARIDKDGDTASITWEMGLGADKGTWKAIGGTGKFAGRADSGWWVPGPPTAKGAGVNRWGGDCK